MRRRSRTSGTRRGRRARLPPHPLTTTAPQAPWASACRHAPGAAAASVERKKIRDGPRFRVGTDRVGTDRSGGGGAGRAARPWECRPSRVVRRASPIATHPAGCPRAMPYRDPQAGVHVLRALRPPWLAAQGTDRGCGAPAAPAARCMDRGCGARARRSWARGLVMPSGARINDPRSLRVTGATGYNPRPASFRSPCLLQVPPSPPRRAPPRSRSSWPGFRSVTTGATRCSAASTW